MDGRKDGHIEIPPCVLLDIGPLGPLPKKLKKRALLKLVVLEIKGGSRAYAFTHMDNFSFFFSSRQGLGSPGWDKGLLA